MSLNLSQPGSRIYLHTKDVTSILSTLIRNIRKMDPSREIIIITSDDLLDPLPVTHFRIFQIAQPFIDALVQSDPVFLIESLPNFGHFTIPRNRGRIIALGTDLTPLKALTETVRFMSGTTPQGIITPWDLAKYLKAIGIQTQSSDDAFVYSMNAIQIPMSPIQYYEYNARLSGDRHPKKHSAIQVTNFLYPPSIQSMHNIPRDQRPQLPLDLLISEGGWIDPQTIPSELQRWSPKLVWLETYLRQYPRRHIIYTAFNDATGVKAISTILKALGHDVVTITSNDRQKDRSTKLEQFKELLVTNLYPFTDYKKPIFSFIMFDQFGDDILLNAYLKRLPSGVHAIFIIATGPNGEPTLETLNYIEMLAQISARNTIVNLLKTGSENLQTVQKNLNIPQLTQIELDANFRTPIPIYTSTTTS